MSASEMYSSELPDLKGLMSKLDAMNEESNKAIRKGINRGGDIILAEQKRLISGKSGRLEKAFKKSKLIVGKKGDVGISTGYQEDSFNTQASHGKKYWQKESVGVIGLTFEFGRPGESPQRSGKTMKQTRKRKKNKKSEAVPTEVEINKGLIVPVPHIRRGFDNKVEEAVNATAEELESAIDKVMNK